MPEDSYSRHVGVAESPLTIAGCCQCQTVRSSSCCVIDDLQRLQSCASDALVGLERLMPAHVRTVALITPPCRYEETPCAPTTQQLGAMQLIQAPDKNASKRGPYVRNPSEVREAFRQPLPA